MAASRSRRRAITLSLLALVISYGLYQAGGIVSGVKGVLGGILAPFSWTVNAISRPIGHLLAGTVNYADVVTQNQQLRAALGRATMQRDVNASAAQTLADLESVLHLPFVGSIPTTVAQVVGESPTNFAATVTISKGSSSGVLIGMPVVANGGLVGTVLATTKGGATVRLITDPNSNVAVTFGSSHANVLMVGRGASSAVTVGAIPVTDPLNKGEVLSTSAQNGSTVPPGIPVATVQSLAVTPGSATYDAVVAPSADLRHLAFVDVLLWEPST